MNEKLSTKLAQVEANLDRWLARLNRANNAIAKLRKQRQRLVRQMAEPPKPSPEKPKPSVDIDHVPEEDLPAFLDRRNPNGIRKLAEEMQAKADVQLVDTLKAKRAPQVEADKKKMPLTDKAAAAYIKAKPKKEKRASPQPR